MRCTSAVGDRSKFLQTDHIASIQKLFSERLNLEHITRASAFLEAAERLLEQRHLEESWQSFLVAECNGADRDRCSAGRWQIAMLRGDFEAAWKESDAIRARGSGDQGAFWRGEDISGKRLIVRSLHGFGDAVQMLRYAPILAAQAKSVVYETSPRLLPLMRCFAGVSNAIEWTDAAPEWDVQLEITEVPYALRTILRDLPVATNYLSLPSKILAKVGRQLGPKHRFRVGVICQCGDWNPSRNVPPRLLAGLQEYPFEFWNLQSRISASENYLPWMRDAREIADGLPELAATIAQMDLIISADTLAAHLAGAMGITAYVMLQYAADWRWMTVRTDTPWYPSLRLFRQPVAGDWEAVVASIQSQLDTLVS